MKVNLISDDFKFKFSSSINREITIRILEKIFIEKYNLDQGLKTKNNNKAKKRYKFKYLFYDIDSNIILSKTYKIKINSNITLNLLIIKKDIPTPKEESLTDVKSLKDVIRKITGARKVMTIPEKVSTSSYIKQKTTQPFSQYSYASINELEIMQEFSMLEIQLDANCLHSLLEIGIDEVRAKLALIIARNNLNSAIELLLSNNFNGLVEIFNYERRTRQSIFNGINSFHSNFAFNYYHD